MTEKCEVHQVIVVRGDLDISVGKLCSQVAHASVRTAFMTDQGKQWMKNGMKKIIVKTRTKNEFYDKIKKANDLQLTKWVVHDRGLTEVESGTATCLGIIGDKKKIDKVVGNLPLLKDFGNRNTFQKGSTLNELEEFVENWEKKNKSILMDIELLKDKIQELKEK